MFYDKLMQILIINYSASYHTGVSMNLTTFIFIICSLSTPPSILGRVNGGLKNLIRSDQFTESSLRVVKLRRADGRSGRSSCTYLQDVAALGQLQDTGFKEASGSVLFSVHIPSHPLQFGEG